MIKRIGNTPIQERHKASCHCGAVVLEQIGRAHV